MNSDFLQNLVTVLAHSMWYEQARALLDDGLPTGLFRNDFSPTPVQRDTPAETAQQLQLQAEYAPKFGAIQRQEAEKFLLGDPLGGTRGLLDLYQGDIAPKYAAADRAAASEQRRADVADVANLGADAMAAFRSANPQQTKLIDRINADTTAELDAGYNLTPGEQRLVSESVRSGQADRGLGNGPSGVFEEAMATTNAGAQRHQQRVDQAIRTVGVNQATAADPFQVVLGRASGAGGMGLLNSASQSAAGVGNQLFGFGANNLDFNANSQQASNIASANNNAALAGAGISAAGSVGSSL